MSRRYSVQERRSRRPPTRIRNPPDKEDSDRNAPVKTADQHTAPTSRKTEVSSNAPANPNSRKLDLNSNKEKLSARLAAANNRRFEEKSNKERISVRMIVPKARPVQQGALSRFTSHVTSWMRKITKHERSITDDEFPRSDREKPFEDPLNPISPNVTTPEVSLEEEKEVALPSGHRSVCGNIMFKGRTMVQGTPFWTQERLYAKANTKDKSAKNPHPLDQNLEFMKALKFFKAKKCVDPPHIVNVLNPYGDLEKLGAKDKLFFNDKLVLSNSIRTMINTMERPEDRQQVYVHSHYKIPRRVKSAERLRAVSPNPKKNFHYRDPDVLLLYSGEKTSAEMTNEDYKRQTPLDNGQQQCGSYKIMRNGAYIN